MEPQNQSRNQPQQRQPVEPLPQQAVAPRFQMVAALDDTEQAEAVLEYALDQAARHQRSELHLVAVVEDAAATTRMTARLTELARRKLAAFPGVVPPERRLRLHVRQGKVVDEIVNLVLEWEPQLLIIGGTSSDGRKPHLGRVAERIMAAVPCPVLAVRVPDYGAHPLRDKQCPDCVAIRARSDGEEMFCPAHRQHGEGGVTGTILLPNNQLSTGGGAMY
jgi:nucleotide-binding universal stress UspA family protein